jgi:hypothetical protein
MQSTRDPAHVDDAQISSSALYCTDIRSIESASEPQFFLGDPQLKALLADTSANGSQERFVCSGKHRA